MWLAILMGIRSRILAAITDGNVVNRCCVFVFELGMFWPNAASHWGATISSPEPVAHAAQVYSLETNCSVVREFSRFWDRVDAILMVGDAQNSILYSS